jgi:hypothetical protein
VKQNQLMDRNAMVAVNRAIRKGILKREPCEYCGASPTHGHHDDYSKPLSVRWFCPSCHRKLHAMEGHTIGEVPTTRGAIIVYLRLRVEIDAELYEMVGQTGLTKSAYVERALEAQFKKDGAK